MESANASAEALRKQIEATEAELARLKAQLSQVEAGAVSQRIDGLSIGEENASLVTQQKQWPLLPEEYKRYGRQMIVPSIGIQGILPLFLFF
jgi:adenylyltransferase/sulfurtransferase